MAGYTIKGNITKILSAFTGYRSFLTKGIKKLDPVPDGPTAFGAAVEKKNNTEEELSLTYQRGTVCCNGQELGYAKFGAVLKPVNQEIKLDWNFPSHIPFVTAQVKLEGKLSYELNLPSFTTNPCNNSTSVVFNSAFKPNITVKIGLLPVNGLVAGRGVATLAGTYTIPSRLTATTPTNVAVSPQVQNVTYKMDLKLGFEICALYDSVCQSWSKTVAQTETLTLGG